MYHQSVFLFIFLIHSDTCSSGIFNPDTYRPCKYVIYADRSICASLYKKESCDGQKLNGDYLTQKVQFSIYHQNTQNPSPYQSEVDVLYKSLQKRIA